MKNVKKACVHKAWDEALTNYHALNLMTSNFVVCCDEICGGKKHSVGGLVLKMYNFYIFILGWWTLIRELLLGGVVWGMNDHSVWLEGLPDILTSELWAGFYWAGFRDYKIRHSKVVIFSEGRVRRNGGDEGVTETQTPKMARCGSFWGKHSGQQLSVSSQRTADATLAPLQG